MADPQAPLPALLLWIKTPTQVTLILTAARHSAWSSLHGWLQFPAACRIIKRTVTSFCRNRGSLCPLGSTELPPPAPAGSLCSMSNAPTWHGVFLPGCELMGLKTLISSSTDGCHHPHDSKVQIPPHWSEKEVIKTLLIWGKAAVL